MVEFDTQEPVYPCPRCAGALARVQGRDGYICGQCEVEFSGTAMAMIGPPNTGVLTQELLEDSFLQVMYGPFWEQAKEIQALPEEGE